MTEPSILDRIVSDKREELARQKELLSLDDLEHHIKTRQTPLNFSGALSGRGVQPIAEVKTSSPSRACLCPAFDPVPISVTHPSIGAAALPVLTDPRFEGELDHVIQIKQSGVSRRAPVLRKDFIFDPYQVYEARAIGADALLLIVAILSPELLKELLTLAHRLWMQCLVEIHDRTELQIAVDAGAEIIGINNRGLSTFTTDLAVTDRLAPSIPRGKVMVSQREVSARDHRRLLRPIGATPAVDGAARRRVPGAAEEVRRGRPVGHRPGGCTRGSCSRWDRGRAPACRRLPRPLPCRSAPPSPRPCRRSRAWSGGARSGP